ncbi:Trace amine-associated receptor 1 [Oryzias melastigma]|uniref:Trace amine-associated receptor 1 n=1 Tax=Oryzias melastigma TaxID=30732 RepID=A0A834BU53_ORYME|nr:Trace amine-associated receptor 1 [Oryzias melastigma]
MVKEKAANFTYSVTDLCYEIDHFSYKLTSSPSVICVILYFFLALLSVITVCGNLLVIVSVAYFKQLHTPTHSLILSLAVADLLVGILVFPLSMAFSLSSCFFYEGLFCKVRDSFDITLSTCSIMNLCCISVDRYFAVCQPLMYKTKINQRVVVVMIVLSWGVSALVGMGVIIVGFNNTGCEDSCLINVLIGNITGPVVAFYFPVIIILCIYLKIFLVAQRQARNIQIRAKCVDGVSKIERKSTKTLATVLGVFLCCWTPFFLCITFLPFFSSPVPVPVIETLSWLALSNSTLNPFIYAFYYRWFRSAFKIIFSGKIFQKNVSNLKLT